MLSRGDARIENRVSKRNSTKLFLRGIWFLWDCMFALRHCLCSYILNLTVVRKPQMKNCVSFFFLVCQKLFGLCGRGGFVPRPKPAQNMNAARDWAFNHFQSRGQCVLGARHEILYVAKRLWACRLTSSHSLFPFWAPWNCTNIFDKNTSSSVLLFFLVEESKRFKNTISQHLVGLLHYSDTFVLSVFIHDQTLWWCNSSV